MGSRSLDDLTPDTREVVERLLARLKELGIQVTVASTLRTCADQAAIYAQGRTAPGSVVTHARGCRSWHTWGRAVDLFVLDGGKAVYDGRDPRYKQMGGEAEKLGMIWGGRFNDPAHVEYHPGLTQSGVCPDPDRCEEIVAAAGVPGSSSWHPPEDIERTGSRSDAGSEFSWGIAAVAAAASCVVGLALWPRR